MNSSTNLQASITGRVYDLPIKPIVMEGKCFFNTAATGKVKITSPMLSVLLIIIFDGAVSMAFIEFFLLLSVAQQVFDYFRIL
jgi:hypothetical protein